MQRAPYNSELKTQEQHKTAIRRQTHISYKDFQLKLEYAVIVTFLKHISKMNSDRCWNFKYQSKINVHYVILHCIVWRLECLLIRKKYETTIGTWPTIVKQLLGSKKATPVLLEFLATTRAGEKPPVQNQKQIERRGRQDKAWGLNVETLEGKTEQEENKKMKSEQGEEQGKARGG